ncbi:hypothetical protein MP228_011009 [Amoeboaphelidium protococcarum]|nr:hypothetical protein MP228_011009 [Amoeboaphelidium protococcarum]
MTDFRYQVQQLQRLDGNKQCVDCGSHNPQWASASFGTFICLECSGQHRSLGVHISFVRSVTMDSWKEEQHNKMKVGGNDKARQFFEKYGIQGMSITQKYQTKAADLYKEKLLAEMQGRDFDLPAPSPELSRVKVAENAATSMMNGGGGNNMQQRMDMGSNSMSSSQMSTKSRNEEYFARKGAENSQRPVDLPPNQGGKYQGFGSDYQGPSTSKGRNEEDILSDAVSAFSKGWSVFGAKAVEWGRYAATQAESIGKDINTNVIKPTASKLQDPNLRQNLSNQLNSIGKNIVETSDKGISFIAHALTGEEQVKSPSSSSFSGRGQNSYEKLHENYDGSNAGNSEDLFKDANDLAVPQDQNAFASQSEAVGYGSNVPQSTLPTSSVAQDQFINNKERVDNSQNQQISQAMSKQVTAAKDEAHRPSSSEQWTDVNDDDWADF